MIIAADIDIAGVGYSETVHRLVEAAGAAEIHFFPSELISPWIWTDGKKTLRDGLPKDGWDLADALQEGWTSTTVAATLADHSVAPFHHPSGVGSFPNTMSDSASWAFRLTETGVEKREEYSDRRTESKAVRWKPICSKLEVIADTRTKDGGDWGRLLRITDRDGVVKEWPMQMALLAGEGATYREKLLRLGLVIAGSRFARDALAEYISTATPVNRIFCTSKVGWNGDEFVLPGSTFGLSSDNSQTIFQSANSSKHFYGTKGSIEAWRENIATYAVGNSRLAFAISAAFAGPLLHLTESESGGFNFRGRSSTGKTTILIGAGSVWGGGSKIGFARSWRATANALEVTATTHNDTLLCLDELSLATPSDASEAAFMLGNGTGKQRRNLQGGNDDEAEWRVLLLSTGETSLDEKIGQDARRQATAGQKTRVVEISADPMAELGIFEELHEFNSGSSLSRHLKEQAARHYGHASHAFLDRLTKDLSFSKANVLAFMKQFEASNKPHGADGQVERVLTRFALVAAAGELATDFGVTGWAAGEASRAAVRCFESWINSRGGVAPAEEIDGIAAVRRFLEQNGMSRFEPMNDPRESEDIQAVGEIRIVNRTGFRRTNDHGETEYLIFPESFKTDVCAGRDWQAIAKLLASKGLLLRGEGNKLQRKVRLPGIANPIRCYVVTAGIFSDFEG